MPKDIPEIKVALPSICELRVEIGAAWVVGPRWDGRCRRPKCTQDVLRDEAKETGNLHTKELNLVCFKRKEIPS